jgi:subtilisin family serine protease
MYTMSFYPPGRLNIKAAFMIPMLLISMFTVISLAATQPNIGIDPSIAKLSPTLLEKITTVGNAPLNVLIESHTNAYATIIADITRLGGTVNYQFKYINGLAATLAADALKVLARNPDIKKIYLDENRLLSTLPMEDDLEEDPLEFSLEDTLTISLTPEEIMTVMPEAYTYWNPVAMGAVDVWETGIFGQGSTAVIIDTGIWANHFMIRGSVIGGVDMSPDVGTPFEGWNSTANHWHGSHVAGILAGHGAILIHSSHPLYTAISKYGEPPPQASSIGYPGYHIVPLFGLAPDASLYIIKVFPHTGAGVPEWRIIAAIEHAIELKETDALDVDIISMSLGGATLFDGRDLEDQTVDVATSVGITVVSAAGNDGPAPMTVSSPGSADTGMTVAAAAHPVNTRVFWDYYYGVPSIGKKLFVSDIPQIYAFSSRGPTSDGRGKPDISATGIFVLSAFPSVNNPNGLAFASGTSMSTPAVSGAVGLLNSYAETYLPAASPEDYKQAIKNGAVWLDGYTENDQGAGYLNANMALTALQEDTSLGDEPPELPKKYKLADITNIPIVGSGEYTASITELAPGYKQDFVFEVTYETDSISLEITNLYFHDGNPLGLNSLEIYIQSAKRTTYGYYIDSANVWGNASFLITDDETTWTGEVTGVFWDPYTRLAPIEPGYVKITIENDWTSFAEISADITITVTETEPETPDLVFSGKIKQDDWTRIPKSGVITPPAGTTKVVIELSWENDWTQYPSADIDMLVRWHDGTGAQWSFDGATLNSPERVIITGATINWFYIWVNGYTVYEKKEPWTIRIYFS